MKASVVGLLVFFVLGIAVKYVLVVPRAVRFELPRKHGIGAFLIFASLSTALLMGAWALELLGFGDEDAYTAEAAVLLSLFCTVAILAILFECVGSENVLVYTVAAGATALHSGVYLFSEHRHWADIAFSVSLVTTGSVALAQSFTVVAG